MKKILIALLLIVPTIILASPTSVNRIDDHIEPLIRSDHIKASYFVASTTNATSTFAGAVGVGTSTPNSKFGVLELIDFVLSDFNTFVGYQTGKYFKPTAISNTFFGYQAGMGSSTAVTSVNADFNTAVGYQSYMNNTSGSLNTALGYQTLMRNTTGTANVAIGYTAMLANTTGFNNVAIGRGTLDANINGSGNVGVGLNALGANVDGVDNFGFGQSALQNNITGDANVCIGRTACQAALGDNNVGIGRSSLAVGTGSGNIGIGYFAGAYETGNNSFYVGNTDFTTSAGEKAGALMYGVMTGSNTTNTLQINGRTGISTTSSFARFSVKGIGTGTGVNFHTTNSSNVPLVTGLDNGNFGIGTTSPYAKLSVVGEVVARNFTATTTTATSTFAGGLTAAGSSGLTVLQNGNVGINKIAPADKLDILGDLNVMSASNNTTAFSVYPSGSGAPAFNVDTTNRRVAVGLSATPAYALDVGINDATVYSATSVTPQGVRILNSDTTANSTSPFYFSMGGTGTAIAAINGIRLSADNSALAFRTEVGGVIGEGMRLIDTKLGIGTTTPVAVLDVYSPVASSTGMLLEAVSGGGCFIMKDTAGGGYTQVTSQGGVLNSKVATSLSTCN